MAIINVDTQALRSVNQEIEDITNALIQTKGELETVLEGINNKINSDEVSAKLKSYKETLGVVCKNTNDTLASLKTYLGEQIGKYESNDASTGASLDAAAKILAQLDAE